MNDEPGDTIEKVIKVTNVYRRNQQATEQTIVNVGGAGSSKSYSVCQYYINDKMLGSRDEKILILRKTRTSLKLSTYTMFLEIMKEMGIYNEYNHNMSEMSYTFPATNTFFLFTGLDNREKIKSTEWDEIWLEEANQFSREDYTFLKTRLRRGTLKHGQKSRIRMTLNPVECWIRSLEGKKDVKIIRSTYKDNPFCNRQAIEILEGLKDEDPVYYKIYALGLWAEARNIIYKPYTIVDKFPEIQDVIYGLDFGYNTPTALIEIGIHDLKNTYEKEILYKTHLTNQDRINILKEKIPPEFRTRPIYADSEDPASIKEIYDAGFNILPADKDVKAGIDFCKRFNSYTKAECENLISENNGYKYREDKNGNVIDEPVKFKDHLMDARRYALWTHLKDSGMITDVNSLKKMVKNSGNESIANRGDW